MFSGDKIQWTNITYPLEFTWISVEISTKQHVSKILCPAEMLSIEIIMYFQPERDKIRVGTGNINYKIFSGADV